MKIEELLNKYEISEFRLESAYERLFELKGFLKGICFDKEKNYINANWEYDINIIQLLIKELFGKDYCCLGDKEEQEEESKGGLLK